MLLKIVLKGQEHQTTQLDYSHLFNKCGGWNKRGGGAKVAKSLNVVVGINVEGGIFWKKLVHNSNKRGVEGGKIQEFNKRGGWIFVLWRVEFFKIGKRGPHVY